MRFNTRATLLKVAFTSAVLTYCSGAFAQPTPYPANPQDMPGKGPTKVMGWFKDNREHFWKKREKQQGAVVFAGSSGIGNWKDLETAFPGLVVANRGIGGDVSRGLLFRYKEDVLDLHPKAIFILIGSNDLSAHGKVSDIISNIGEMINLTKEHAPQAAIVLCTLPPRENPKAPLRSPTDLTDLNSSIVQLASTQPNVKVLDLYPLFLGENGTLNADLYGPDRMHFSKAGYAKFQEASRKVLEELKLL